MCSDELPPDPSSYRIVPGAPKSELESFASFFHQDWALMYDSFYLGAHKYIEGLPDVRKSELKNQLTEFVDTHKNKNPAEWKKAWLELGAHAWQDDLVIRETLLDFIEML